MNNRAILVDGKVVTGIGLSKWGSWMKNPEHRYASKTVVKDSEVSTVFLGLNHGYVPDVDLWFETMVFGGPMDQEQERYTTLEQAKAGHERMIQRVKASYLY